VISDGAAKVISGVNRFASGDEELEKE